MQENEIVATPHFGKLLWRAEGAVRTKYPSTKDLGNGHFERDDRDDDSLTSRFLAEIWVSITIRAAWSRTSCGAIARCKKRLCKLLREEAKRSEREQARQEEKRRANFSYEKDCCK